MPHLNASLVPLEHHAWLRHVLESVPRETAHFLGFESRLGDDTGATDCALSLTAAGVGNPGRDFVGPAWDRLRAFLQLWRDSEQGPAVDATRIWLEFDMGAAPLAPNLLFGYWPRTHEPLRSRQWLLDEAIPAVLGMQLSAALRYNIECALDACPTCDDFQIGLMCARPVPVVRLCVFDLPDAARPDYLAALGWRGDAAQLDAFVQAFRPHADFVGLHFDMSEQVYPHVGIEPGFEASSWGRQPHREPRWVGQFDVLIKAGLMTEPKHRALLDWPGYQRLDRDGSPTALLRGLSHLKVVLQADGRSQAKAYFGIAERPLGAEDAIIGR